MFERVTANILSRYLTEYIEGVSADDLRLGLWSGDVSLENLTLQKKALALPGLHVSISHGFIGRLRIQVPWNKVLSESIVISIEELYLYISPNEWNEEDVLFRKELKKKNEVIDARQKRTGTGNRGAAQWVTSVASRLFVRMFDNAQFNIKDLYILYGDNVCQPQHPYMMGLKIDGLNFFSTNDKWLPEFVHAGGPLIHKMIDINNFSLFMNTDIKALPHFVDAREMAGYFRRQPRLTVSNDQSFRSYQFIVEPMNIVMRLAIRSSVEPHLEIPKATISIETSHSHIAIEDSQNRRLVDLYWFLTVYGARRERYGRFRPSSCRPIESPRKWLDYACSAVLFDIREKKRQWCGEYFSNRRKLRMKYMNLWQSFVTTGLPESSLPHELEELDKILTASDIILFRSLSEQEFVGKRAIPKPNPEAQTWREWIWTWMGTETNNEIEISEQDGEKPSSLSITKEEKEKLWRAIGYDPDRFEEKEPPRGYVHIRAKLSVKSSTLALGINSPIMADGQLRQHTDWIVVSRSSGTKMIIEDYVDDLEKGAGLVPDLWTAIAGDNRNLQHCVRFSLNVGSLDAIDLSTPQTLTPYVLSRKLRPDLEAEIRARTAKNNDMAVSSAGVDPSLENEPFQGGKHVLHVDGTYIPNDNLDVEAFLSVRVQPLNIVLSPGLLQRMTEFALPEDSFSIVDLNMVGINKMGSRMSRYAAKLEYLWINKVTLHVSVDMFMPSVTVPMDPTVHGSPMLVADLNNVTIVSEAPHTPRRVSRAVQAQAKLGLRGISDEQLTASFYDNFHIVASETKLYWSTIVSPVGYSAPAEPFIFGSRSQAESALMYSVATQGSDSVPLTNTFGIDLLARLSALPSDESFTSKRLNALVEPVDILLTPATIQYFLRAAKVSSQKQQLPSVGLASLPKPLLKEGHIFIPADTLRSVEVKSVITRIGFILSQDNEMVSTLIKGQISDAVALYTAHPRSGDFRGRFSSFVVEDVCQTSGQDYRYIARLSTRKGRRDGASVAMLTEKDKAIQHCMEKSVIGLDLDTITVNANMESIFVAGQLLLNSIQQDYLDNFDDLPAKDESNNGFRPVSRDLRFVCRLRSLQLCLNDGPTDGLKRLVGIDLWRPWASFHLNSQLGGLTVARGFAEFGQFDILDLTHIAVRSGRILSFVPSDNSPPASLPCDLTAPRVAGASIHLPTFTELGEQCCTGVSFLLRRPAADELNVPKLFVTMSIRVSAVHTTLISPALFDRFVHLNSTATDFLNTTRLIAPDTNTQPQHKNDISLNISCEIFEGELIIPRLPLRFHDVVRIAFSTLSFRRQSDTRSILNKLDVRGFNMSIQSSQFVPARSGRSVVLPTNIKLELVENDNETYTGSAVLSDIIIAVTDSQTFQLASIASDWKNFMPNMVPKKRQKTLIHSKSVMRPFHSAQRPSVSKGLLQHPIYKLSHNAASSQPRLRRSSSQPFVDVLGKEKKHAGAESTFSMTIPNLTVILGASQRETGSTSPTLALKLEKMSVFAGVDGEKSRVDISLSALDLWDIRRPSDGPMNPNWQFSCSPYRHILCGSTTGVGKTTTENDSPTVTTDSQPATGIRVSVSVDRNKLTVVVSLKDPRIVIVPESILPCSQFISSALSRINFPNAFVREEPAIHSRKPVHLSVDLGESEVYFVIHSDEMRARALMIKASLRGNIEHRQKGALTLFSDTGSSLKTFASIGAVSVAIATLKNLQDFVDPQPNSFDVDVCEIDVSHKVTLVEPFDAMIDYSIGSSSENFTNQAKSPFAKILQSESSNSAHEVFLNIDSVKASVGFCDVNFLETLFRKCENVWTKFAETTSSLDPKEPVVPSQVTFRESYIEEAEEDAAGKNWKGMFSSLKEHSSQWGWVQSLRNRIASSPTIPPLLSDSWKSPTAAGLKPKTGSSCKSTHLSMKILSGGVELVLRSDRDDKDLLKVMFKDSSLEVNAVIREMKEKTSSWNASCSSGTTISVDYFNQRHDVHDWEPAIEPWTPNLVVSSASDTLKNSRVTVKVSAPSRVELNITQSLLKALHSIQTAMMISTNLDTEQAHVSLDVTLRDYVNRFGVDIKPLFIRNTTHETLSLDNGKILFSVPFADFSRFISPDTLPSLESMEELTTIYHAHVACVIVESSTSLILKTGVKPVTVEIPLKLGHGFVPVKGDSTNSICHISRTSDMGISDYDSDSKFIWLSSKVVVVNCTALSLDILVDMENIEDFDGRTLLVKAGGSDNIPLSLADNSRIRIRPTATNFSFYDYDAEAINVPKIQRSLSRISGRRAYSLKNRRLSVSSISFSMSQSVRSAQSDGASLNESVDWDLPDPEPTFMWNDIKSSILVRNLRHLACSVVSCASSEPGIGPLFFLAHVDAISGDSVEIPTRYALHFSAPLVVENLLPMSISFDVVDTSQGLAVHGLAEVGEEVLLHSSDPASNHELTIRSTPFESITPALISLSDDPLLYTETSESGMTVKKMHMPMVHVQTGDSVLLSLEIGRDEFGTTRVSVFCSHWILNQTSMKLLYREYHDSLPQNRHNHFSRNTDGGLKTLVSHLASLSTGASSAAGSSFKMLDDTKQSTSESVVSMKLGTLSQTAELIAPELTAPSSLLGFKSPVATNTMSLNTGNDKEYELFGFDHDDRRMVIRTSDSEWCRPFLTDSIGIVGAVEMRGEKYNRKHRRLYEFGVSIELAPLQFYRTRIVTITPRYSITNLTHNTLCLKQFNTDLLFPPLLPCFGTKSGSSPPKKRHSLSLPSDHAWTLPLSWWPNSESKFRQLALHISDDAESGWEWSGPLSVDKVGDWIFRVRNSRTGEFELVRMDVSLNQRTINVLFHDEDALVPPYRIMNDTLFHISMQQEGSKFDPDTLSPFSSTVFGWDDPFGRQRVVISFPHTSTRRVFSLDKDKAFKPISYPKSSHGICVEVVADGPTRVLHLYDPRAASNQLHTRVLPMKDLGSASESVVEREKVSELPESEEKSFLSIEVDVAIEGVGLSVIDDCFGLDSILTRRELLYLTLKDVHLSVQTSAVADSILHLSIGDIQIDNQMADTPYPVMLSCRHTGPTAISLMFVRAPKTESGPTFHFKRIFVMLCEMDLTVDEYLVSSIIEAYAQLPESMSHSGHLRHSESRTQTFPPLSIPVYIIEPTASSSNILSKVYIGLLEIHPIRINVSLCPSPKADDMIVSPSSFFLHAVGFTLKHFTNVEFRLAGLVLEHPFVPWEQLIDRITSHYVRQILFQFYKVIGGADVLGDPVGLVNSVSRGVYYFFYQSLKSLLRQPEELPVAVITGALSMVQHAVYGTAGFASKITASMSKGLTYLTFDTAYTREKESYWRQRPRTRVDEILIRGARRMTSGISEGAVGLVAGPVRGAESNGLKGLLKGVAVGAIGLAVKPTTGILEMISSVAEAVQVGVLNVGHNCSRVRPPRYFGHMEPLPLTVYEENNVVGQHILHYLKAQANVDENLNYCSSSTLKNGAIILVTDEAVMIVKGRIATAAISSDSVHDYDDPCLLYVPCASIVRVSLDSSDCSLMLLYLPSFEFDMGGEGKSVPGAVIRRVNTGLNSSINPTHGNKPRFWQGDQGQGSKPFSKVVQSSRAVFASLEEARKIGDLIVSRIGLY